MSATALLTALEAADARLTLAEDVLRYQARSRGRIAPSRDRTVANNSALLAESEHCMITILVVEPANSDRDEYERPRARWWLARRSDCAGTSSSTAAAGRRSASRHRSFNVAARHAWRR